MKRVLITGASGFFGSHFVEHLIKSTDWHIICMTRSSHAGNLTRLYDIDVWSDKRTTIIWHDFRDPINDFNYVKIGKPDYIVHAGAESHVDRSIANPRSFVESNIIGTLNLLEYAKTIHELKWFHYFSTDEVTGPAPDDVDFDEQSPINPTNPYSATKLGAEALVNAFGNTYDLPVFITRTMNLIGERQNKEKFLPLVMRKVLLGETVLIHADVTKTKPGKRHYLHCRNAAAATLFLLKYAEQRNIYNVVGDVELDNLTFAQMIAAIIGKPLIYEMVDFHSSRPGHDLRYSLDGSKLKRMGFTYPVSFKESLEQTVKWTLKNPEWLEIDHEAQELDEGTSKENFRIAETSL